MQLLKSSFKAVGVVILIVLCSGPLTNCDCGGEHFADAQLEVDNTSLKFDDVAVGYPQTRILRISNIGGTGLRLNTVAVRGGDTSPFSVLGVQGSEAIEEVPGLVSPLAPNFIDLVVEYDPAAIDSEDSDILDVLTNDPDECFSAQNPCEIQLNGNGAPPNAELEVICQEDETCPPPNDSPVCQIMLDPGTNSHPMRASFNFCEVSKGNSRELNALLKNIGNIPLTMNGFELFGIVGQVDHFAILAPDQVDIVIQPQAEQMLSLVYAPKATSNDNAGLDTDVNDDDIPSNEFTVRLLAYSTEPDINVHPTHIPFEGVTQGSSDTKQITINNIGSGTLIVEAPEVTGGSIASEFSISPTEGFTVASMGQQIVDVTYSPQDAGRDEGSVIIRSNDPDEESVVVTLGADVRPDLEATPQDVVEFIDVEPGGSDSQDVLIRNIGYADLTITDIDFNENLNPGDPPVFGVDGLPADFPANPLILAPTESYTFLVNFTDNTLIENEIGQLEIDHDSPNDSNPYIILAQSKGTPANLPPVAIIDPPSQTVHGLDPIALNGANSFDPDAGDSISRYQWMFLFLPQDAQGNQSQSVLTSTDLPQTSFTPDIHGTYIVRLVVYDSFNTPSQAVDSEISVNP